MARASLSGTAATRRGCSGSVEVDHHQAGVGGDIGEMAGQRDVARAVEHAVRVPGHRAPQDVVARLAVGQRVDVDQDQPLLGVGDDGVVVDRRGTLFLVRRAHRGVLRSGAIGWLVGSAMQVALCVATWVSWPSGENGAVTIRSETPLLAIEATS